MSASTEQIDISIDANSEALADIVQLAADQVDDAIRENHTSLGRVLRAAKKPVIDGIKRNMQLLGSVMEPIVNGIDSAIAENAGLLSSADTDMAPIPAGEWSVYCTSEGAVAAIPPWVQIDTSQGWSLLARFPSEAEANAYASRTNCANGTNGDGALPPPTGTGKFQLQCNEAGEFRVFDLTTQPYIAYPPIESNFVSKGVLWATQGHYDTLDDAISAGQVLCSVTTPPPPPPPDIPFKPPPPLPAGCVCVDIRLPKELLDLARCLCDWLKRDMDSSGEESEALACDTNGELYSGM